MSGEEGRNWAGEEGPPEGEVAQQEKVFQFLFVSCSCCSFGKLCPEHFIESARRLVEGRSTRYRSNVESHHAGLSVGDGIAPPPDYIVRHNRPSTGRVITKSDYEDGVPDLMRGASADAEMSKNRTEGRSFSTLCQRLVVKSVNK